MLQNPVTRSPALQNLQIHGTERVPLELVHYWWCSQLVYGWKEKVTQKGIKKMG